MSQSSTIAFFLIVGFIVFVTMKGQLPAYAAILLGNSPNNSTTPQTTTLTPLPSLPTLPGMGEQQTTMGIGGISF